MAFFVGVLLRRSLHDGPKSKFVKIGDVRVAVKDAKRPELVPVGFADKNPPSSIVHALKWLLQKDALKQDVFLIGVPGSLRSSLVMAYLEICNREFEFLSVTRDTTEADIKQRREISGGNAFYSDLCAVRAALNGRVLVIDGVEKAERNVLPILNNLLENREMQLDDGRFLMAANKYDKLREKYSEEELKRMKLERVSENFHVIALGIPVPTFKGHTLDPPLRSRFQCRNLTELPFETMSQLCSFFAPKIGLDRVNNLLSLVFGMNSQKVEGSTICLPLFPIDNLIKACRIWNLNPSYSEEAIFNLCYPRYSILKAENQLPILEEFFEKFSTTREQPTHAQIQQVDLKQSSADVTVSFDGHKSTFTVPSGASQPAKRHQFVSTPAYESLLADLTATHAVADWCLLGARGSGKTTVIEELARRLGYETETIVLYQDMNSRELVQQRKMLPNGDTVWEDSQLVRAAKKGSLCVLDGLEKVHWSTAEMLAPLIHHRYLQLPDGTRLLGAMYYDALKTRTGFSDELLEQKGIHKIADGFRIVALGDSESASSSRWLNEQLLSMFIFHSLKPMSVEEQCLVVSKLVPNACMKTTRKLVAFVEKLRSSADAGVRGIATSLSLRRLIYILRRFSENPQEGIYEAVNRAALSRFMPGITRAAFETAMKEAQIMPDAEMDASEDNGWRDRLSAASKASASAGSESMVPDIVFFDNKQHKRVMNDMAKDFELGSHLLVIGNQGVGKNKITDRFLQLIHRPRQYMQLHRDTTVQSLTVQTTVVDGVLKHEDSPLVKAVRDGLVLVVDEADKAPLYVVAVLKSLLDSGVLYLSDGRRIQPAEMPEDKVMKAIPIHPEFRLIMLANRPGFPFLGNDLFAVLGDLFSVHVVENPSRASELAMLRQYAPDVPDEQLNQLVAAFDELREMADNALLSYPYSTRELVNIVKHLQLFPNDPLTAVVRNVFDFDAFTPETTQTIETVFQKYGIPIGVKKPSENIFLSRRFPLAEARNLGDWGVRMNTQPALMEPKFVQVVSQSDKTHMRRAFALNLEHARATGFTEQQFAWQLPISDVNICSDILELPPPPFGSGREMDSKFVSNRLVVATVNPPTLFVIPDQRKPIVEEIDLSEYFAKCNRGDFRPRIKLARWKDSHALLHEEMSNTLLLLDVANLQISRLNTDGTPASAFEAVMNRLTPNPLASGTKHWRLVDDAERPVLFEREGDQMRILMPDDLPAGAQLINLPEGFCIDHVVPVNKDRYLVVGKEGTQLLTFESDGRVFLRPLEESADIPRSFNSLTRVAQEGGRKAAEFHLASNDFYALKSEQFPDALSSGTMYGWRRPPVGTEPVADARPPFRAAADKFALHHPQREVLTLQNGLVIRGMPSWMAPAKALPPHVPIGSVAGFLEVVDPKRNTVQYIPVPVTRPSLYHSTWVASLSKTPFMVCKSVDEKAIFTCETTGSIRKWEVDELQLMQSLQNWHKLFGDEDANARIEFERSESDVDMSKLTDPTVGKVDPDNAPHVGGNMWMGGTGGYNTAGLGGAGGPFRLDAGHDVHQIHDSAKQQVPEEYRQRAREINRKEYYKRLKEIDMSEHDAKNFDIVHGKISKQVNHMKSVIDSLEAREHERQWVKHQTSGDLDDGKLIEGMTGEKSIYRRRMDQLPEPGTVQTKPKRLRLVFDVSGSMYRFNGHDSRLQRSMETALMVMEAFDGKQDKIKYDIVGHSGDGPEHSFTAADKPPTNEKQKFDVIKKMFLQSQFCLSGDFTLEALDMAIAKMAKESDVDERFVIVLSDANLDRYGIHPRHLTKLLDSDPNVNAFVILVGSLGEQADRLMKALPAGKAFYAKDTAQLPQIMQSIFASTLIK